LSAYFNHATVFFTYPPQDHAAAAAHEKARVLDPSSFELPSLTSIVVMKKVIVYNRWNRIAASLY